MNNRDDSRFRSRRRLARLAVALVLPILFAGCEIDDLLSVDAPSQMPADDMENPANAALLVNGAIADFECAYGAFVVVQGLIGDELGDAQLGAASWPYDRRDADLAPGGDYGVQGCAGGQRLGVYRPISTARWSADNALSHLQNWTDAEVPNRTALIARAALYSGLSYTLLGMAMCSAAIDSGPEISSEQLLAEAEARFGTAIEAASAAGLPDAAMAARAGRARVRLYQGDGAGAVTDAQQVPLHFTYNATASQDNARRYNRVFHVNVLSTNYTIEEQSRKLLTGGVEDPRTLTSNAGINANDGTTLWIQHKYEDYGTPIPIVTGGEAALIVAEVQGGSTAVDIINSLRDRHSLPHFDGGTEADIRDELVEERRRELWLQGQRLYDIARFDVPRIPAPGTPYPKGGVYGSATCLPIPDVERHNNPNIG